jgi:predicted nucleic acid-binding protein
MRTAKTAELIYVDPSALRSLYVHDARSRALSRWRARHPGPLPITHHAQAELFNAFALGAFRGDLSTSEVAAAVADYDSDVTAGRLVRADLSFRLTFDRAAALSLAYSPRLGTRALDVLHVASALELACRSFVTYDARQTALAQAVGLRVEAP